MPRNGLTYAGVLLLVGAACLWVGAELATRIEGIAAYAAGAGAVLFLLGLAQEARRRRGAILRAAGDREGKAGS